MANLRAAAIKRIHRGSSGTFLGAAVVLGILVGIGAAALVLTIESLVEFVAYVHEEVGTQATVVAAVVIGMFLTWVIDRVLGPGVSGGGVGEVMSALSLNAGYLSSRLIPGKIVATGLSLGTGGSGGREGPIVLIGAAIGSAFARYSRFGQDEIRAFVAAGAGAGIGAVFNAPIAGILFTLEVILGSLAIRHLNAVVVVSVAASVTSQAIVGEDSFLRSPPYQLEDPRQLILFSLLAVVIVVFGYAFLEMMHFTNRVGDRHLPGWVKPVLAGLAVGLIGLMRPEALGTGQEFLRTLLRSVHAGGLHWWILGLIALSKMLTASFTHGGGGSVGSFMPSMVIGGTIGAGFALVLENLWTASRLDPGAYALVGMAAMLTVVVRAPLTSILLVFELTGSYGMVLPLMLASIIAAVIAERLHPGSIYAAALRSKGIHLLQREDRDVLDTVAVRDVMTWVPTVNPASPVSELQAIMTDAGHHGVPVVDEEDRLMGIVTLTDLDTIAETDQTEEILVAQIMGTRPVTASPTMPVSAALARMASLGLGRLPVIDSSGALVGMFRRESVVRGYHHALSRSASNELYRARVNLRSNRHTEFFEITVRDGSPIADKLVKDVAWPPEATLVSIRRHQSVIIPHGQTTIRMGDELTVYCEVANRGPVRELIEPPRLKTPPD